MATYPLVIGLSAYLTAIVVFAWKMTRACDRSYQQSVVALQKVQERQALAKRLSGK